MARLVPFVLLIAACTAGAGGADDSSAVKGGDSCPILGSGIWDFSGSAFGMGDATMTGEVTWNGCTFTVADWSMAMDDLPSGGALNEDAVQLDGLNSYWRRCTGTLAESGYIAGTCSDDGADWKMEVETY